MFQHSNQNYEGVNFGTQDLRCGELKSCTFYRCSFANGSLDEITSSNCRFMECDFRGVSFNGSIHKESAFENCNFNGANLFVSKFESCKMTGSDFTGANMDGIRLPAKRNYTPRRSYISTLTLTKKLQPLVG